MPESSGTDGATSVADRILDEVKIPTLPEAAVKLLTLCRDELAGAGEIVRVVELDPALSARLLKVANSAAFGQQCRVDTLTRAAVVLGNENLQVVSLGFYLTRGWDGMGFKGFDVREFWRDSVLRACLARRLAKAVRFEPCEQAFLVGILQDIGTLIMGTYFAEEYAAVVHDRSLDVVCRQALENARFGTDHAQVTKSLAQRWRFPDTLVKALGRKCTEPPLARSKDSDEILWQISHFCGAVPFSPDGQTARLGGQLRNVAYCALGLSFEGLSNVFTDVVEQFNALRGVFVHLIPDGCEVESIMREAAELIRSSDTQINEEIS